MSFRINCTDFVTTPCLIKSLPEEVPPIFDLRQGVDCRQHNSHDPPNYTGSEPQPNPDIYGDHIRDENLPLLFALEPQRYWTKVGRNVTVTVHLGPLVGPSPGGRISMVNIGQLPFRQNPFIQPPDESASPGDKAGVSGSGAISQLYPETGTSAPVPIQILPNFESRPVGGIGGTYADPTMATYPDALRTYGTVNGDNSCFLKFTLPAGGGWFGSATFTYEADIDTIHPPGYQAPVNPITGEPYPCYFPAEYTELNPPQGPFCPTGDPNC